jgi:5'-nucleotidase
MAQQEDRGDHFVLGVDVDGVLAGYQHIFRTVVAEATGVAEEDIPEQADWDFAKSGWPIRNEEHYRELHLLAVTQYHIFANSPVIEGASDALWHLSDAGVHIRIITHRLYVPWGHAAVMADTAAWLQVPREDNGKPRIPYRDICFMGDKTDVGADLYIEDAPPNIEALRRARSDVICFDQSYNRHLPGLRAKSWPEVERIVLDRVQQRGLTLV